MRTYVLAATMILLALFLILLVRRRRASEGFTANTIYEIPYITWSYWEGDPMPEIVKLAHERREKKLTGWKVHMLSPDTLPQYIDMTTAPSNYYTLSPQHKADWIRVALLKRYGGVWLDSTIIINDGDALNRLVNASEENRSEFTGFTTFTEPGNSSYIENWFMMAPKHSEFIKTLYDEYERAINIGFAAYKKEIMADKDIKINPKIYKPDDDSVYLTQHACIQAVMQKRLGRKPRILLNLAEESMYKLQNDCKWDAGCLLKSINKPETYKIPYLKLSSATREFDVARFFKEGFTGSIGNRVGWAA